MPRKFSSSTGIDGLLIVNKPVGPSSMDVVRRVRRAAKNTKTGHAGTLDPLADGVVICCLGKATKKVEALMNLPKTYEAQIDLSAFSTTDDREGAKQKIENITPPTLKQIQTACQNYTGAVKQRPPDFSAIHINGKRAYKLARAGEEIKIPKRIVQIYSIEILAFTFPLLDVKVKCGRGTYIRSLARELGENLKTGGYLTALTRTSVGDFNIENAHKLDDLEKIEITKEMLL